MSLKDLNNANLWIENKFKLKWQFSGDFGKIDCCNSQQRENKTIQVMVFVAASKTIHKN